MDELNEVLKHLKTGKSKDPNDYIYELFKDGIIGSDLRKSLLLMINKMKKDMKIPECLRTANITILHKKKSKIDLQNWRGIFVTSVIRGILMKMIYKRTYKTIDSNMSDAQIGARKNKSVRNHLFVLNSVIKDVLSSKKKEPIDVNVMDFRQMFDAEELPQVLNAFYESGIKDDLLALLCEANKNVTFAVKTPSGKTESRSIQNKIMQGDVMSPLMSSNFVDVNIVKPAVETGNVYLYKNKVSIPPLIMQDDTLTISICGKDTKKMNQMINTNTSTMGLQFGIDKCVKMHIGKKHNKDICGEGKVDSWKEIVVKTKDGSNKIEDVFEGEAEMKTVDKTKYLGDTITTSLKNETNIKDKTNKAFGNVNRIVTSIKERPYGKYTYKAVKLMRDGMMVGSMLNNSETWINVNKSDLEKLEKPDVLLSEKVFETKAAKAFQYLEMGILPVKFVIMEKRLKFLKYILDESMSSMIRQVYEAQKVDPKKGDFCELLKEDFKETNWTVTENEICVYTRTKWNKEVKQKVENTAFEALLKENEKKSKTRLIKYKCLKMQQYLLENTKTKLSKTVFKLRSGTLNIKALEQWKHEDNLCVMCEVREENISHFMSCENYGEKVTDWESIYGNDTRKQFEIAQETETRLKIRENKLQEDGLDSLPAPTTPKTFLFC